MKNLVRICLVIILVFLLSFALNAQDTYAKLEPNRNIQAKDLIHTLNKTGDTLILESKTKINYLYSVNRKNGRDFDVFIDTTHYKLPLYKLPIGKHVLVAVQSPKRIVFVIKVLKDIPEPNSVKLVEEKVVAVQPRKLAVSTNN